ncbi:MAG: amylo-alpha-1,6-glucosidase [Deinococcus sp.]|uniref:amylo-alpha-1,6-glucosidase n=1 Tax=Deinococcus sp. TaxID=47478 RepID=UPI0026DC92B0|nr:amylo-alpha-1,6-glucosidase [Deinococcus sp.]MDO4245902.1 amylo-alpha-1,6-glucosidase [Deinococcus sp.]
MTSAAVSPASAYTYGPQAARNPDLEVLLTDGQGGFAMSSLTGVPTRCYSGLVVSQQPPVDRYCHLVSPLERLEVGGESVDLHTLEVAPGVFEGRGLDLLTGATVWDLLPEREQLWRGVRVRRHACMPQDSGALVLLYEVRARQSVTLTLGGFFVDRDMHAVHTATPHLQFRPQGHEVLVQGERDTSVRLLTRFEGGRGASVLAAPLVQALTPQPFSQRLYYRADAARGESPHDYALGCPLWSVTLPPGGGEVALVVQGVAPQASGVPDPWIAFEAELVRRRSLAERAWQATGIRDELVATLAIAADAYLVRRGPVRTNPEQSQAGGQPLSVIAGYPWFADWGRDAMIALSGLTLVTGRPEDAQELLLTFLSQMKRGLIPNHFDERGQGAGYNTVDAPLWLAVSLERYARTTGDALFVRRTLPLLREMLGHFVEGTDFGIRMDPEDGLLLSGEEGTQLTWMDVKIQDWVVTPRHGKPVEIQALWLSALGAELRLSQALGEAPQFAEVLEKAHHSFKQKFWNDTALRSSAPATTQPPLNVAQLGGSVGGLMALSDLLDTDLPGNNAELLDTGPQPTTPGLAGGLGVGRRTQDAPLAILADGLTPQGERDLSARPNALIALSLMDTPVVDEQIDAVLAQTERELLTPLGLHTLSPQDPRYLGHSGGPQLLRDAAYHQGTVWPWPLAAYVELLLSRGEINRARATLTGLTGHLWEAGIGHISEVFSGDTLTPGGCPFQAWSVAEMLRAHVLVSISEAQRAEEQRLEQQGLASSLT